MGPTEHNAIEVRHVSKSYRVRWDQHTSLAERALSLFRRRPAEVFHALRDLSLTVPFGAFVGVIGANGAGKSTLLKVISGLLPPDSGAVSVGGTVTPLLELGLGFQGELTARENVALYGAILGFPPGEMAARVEEVIVFAELEQFADARLKSFSSGMVARLGLATALHAAADILLLDEVLAVGDARFQQKCFDAFGTLKKQRSTILFVSHDVGSVQRFCDHVVWLDRGQVAMAGEPQHVVTTYLDIMQQDALSKASQRNPIEVTEPVRRFGDGKARIVAGRLEDEDGTPLSIVRSGTRVVLRLIAEFDVESTEPIVGFGLRKLGTLGSHVVYTTNNDLLGVPTGRLGPGDRVEICMPFTAAPMNGSYTVFVAIADRTHHPHATTFLDWINEFLAFSVEDNPCLEGVMDLRAEFEFERLAGRHDGLLARRSL